MAFKILTINDAGAVNHAIDHCIRSEFDGIMGDYAVTVAEGLARLAGERYDLILCAMAMEDREIEFFRGAALHSGLNRATPFAALAAMETENYGNRLAATSIRAILSIPFDPHQFSVLINELFSRQERRLSQRYHISQGKATIALGDRIVPADIINVSATGLLCCFSCQEHPVNVFAPCTLSLHLPDRTDTSALANFKAHLVRLIAKGWDEDGGTRFLDAVWSYPRLSQLAEKMLRQASNESSAA